MAIFHLDFELVKRSEGMSSCAKAAYHARCKIVDERTGDIYDFSHRNDLFHHLILSPPQTPAHIIESSSALWNEVERVERQKNGQTARYFNVAIPVELNNEDKIKLVTEYCQENFVDKGMIADIVFHDLDSDNPHAHVMLTLKDITPAGFTKKNRDWNDKSLIEKWRCSWATTTNRYLANIGTDARIDHRSLEAQKEEAIEFAKRAKEAGDEKAVYEHLARAIELNRPAISRIRRQSWHTSTSRELRAAEQQEADAAKQRAKDFRQLYKEYGNYITVNLNTFRIETVKPKQAPQQPVLMVPEPKRRFNTIERKTGDMSLYYGVKAKSTPPPLLRRKSKLGLRKIYDFIKTFMSVLVKHSDLEAEKPGGTTTPKPTEPMVADPLDEVMIDPVTKLKITRREWEAMGTSSKPAQVSITPEANYKHEPEKKQESDLTVRFPPLPKKSKVPAKSKGFTLPKLRFGSSKHKDE